MEHDFNRINIVLTVDSLGFLQECSRMSDETFILDECIDLKNLRQGQFSCLKCQSRFWFKIGFKFASPVPIAQGKKINIHLEAPSKPEKAERSQEAPSKPEKPVDIKVESSVEHSPALPKNEVVEATEVPEVDYPESHNFEDDFKDEPIDDFETGFEEDMEYLDIANCQSQLDVEWLEEDAEEIKVALAKAQLATLKTVLMQYRKRPWWDPYFKPKKISRDLCPVCGKKRDLTHVQDEHPSYYQRICELCGNLVNTNRMSMAKHRLTNCGERERHACQYCDTERKYASSVLKHEQYCYFNPNHKIRDITRRPYVCDICHLRFAHKTLLENHINRLHNPEAKVYCCPSCSFKSVSEVRFKHHTATNHIPGKPDKPFRCPFLGCEKEFEKKMHLRIHQRVHSDKRAFVCSICDKAYKHACDLTNHMNIHTGEFPYSCRFCDRRFNDRGNKNSHQRNVHGKELENMRVNR